MAPRLRTSLAVVVYRAAWLAQALLVLCGIVSAQATDLPRPLGRVWRRWWPFDPRRSGSRRALSAGNGERSRNLGGTPRGTERALSTPGL
jgi:hypothetical protein